MLDGWVADWVVLVVGACGSGPPHQHTPRTPIGIKMIETVTIGHWGANPPPTHKGINDASSDLAGPT